MSLCSVPSCTNTVMAHGYCMTHYTRWRKYGDVLADVPVQKKGQPKPLCTVEGCTNQATIRGHCGGHAKRLKVYGDVQADVPLRESVSRDMPIDERLWSRVDQSGGPDACWPWLGRTEKGYGKIRFNGRNIFTHRLAYELVHGYVPEGMILDHTCHTVACKLGEDCPHRRCCNPSHMVPVTIRENVQRGRVPLRKIEQTHCVRGHLYDADNTYIRPNGDRYCRTCHRLYNKTGVPL